MEMNKTMKCHASIPNQNLCKYIFVMNKYTNQLKITINLLININQTKTNKLFESKQLLINVL